MQLKCSTAIIPIQHNLLQDVIVGVIHKMSQVGLQGVLFPARHRGRGVSTNNIGAKLVAKGKPTHSSVCLTLNLDSI